MALKQLKPTTPGNRGKVNLKYVELTRKSSEKILTKGIKKNSGRGGDGKISVRRKGGGAKRKYRIIDFKRRKFDIQGMIKSIEYDPNRNAFIALVVYADGEKNYVLATANMIVGNKVISGEDVKSVEGNCLPLGKINIGAFVHNIELQPNKGGQMVRAAGTGAKILGRDGNKVSMMLPSGEVRIFDSKCKATVGVLSNHDAKNIKLGKAGASRWRGRRPKVRGVAMNPIDHPMGGGEGKTSGGRHPCSPTGVLTKGFKTRKKKYSDKFIIRRKKKK